VGNLQAELVPGLAAAHGDPNRAGFGSDRDLGHRGALDRSLGGELPLHRAIDPEPVRQYHRHGGARQHSRLGAPDGRRRAR